MNPYNIDIDLVRNKRIAVRCNSEEEAKAFICAVLEACPSNENGYWRDNAKSNCDGWTCWENSDTCYDIECGYDLWRCDALWYMQNGYEVWNFSELLTDTEEMDEVDDISFSELFSKGVVL